MEFAGNFYLCKSSMSREVMDARNSMLWATCNVKSVISLVKKKQQTITLLFKHS